MHLRSIYTKLNEFNEPLGFRPYWGNLIGLMGTPISTLRIFGPRVPTSLALLSSARFATFCHCICALQWFGWASPVEVAWDEHRHPEYSRSALLLCCSWFSGGSNPQEVSRCAVYRALAMWIVGQCCSFRMLKTLYLLREICFVHARCCQWQYHHQYFIDPMALKKGVGEGSPYATRE